MQSCLAYMVEDKKVRSQAVREVVVYACLLASEEMSHGVVLRVSWLVCGKLRRAVCLGCRGPERSPLT